MASGGTSGEQAFFLCSCYSHLVCTTCLNVLDSYVLDSPGISLLLCSCCPFHNMVCSRTCLVLSPYAHPKAWRSRSHACKIVVEEFPERAQAKSYPFSSQLFICAPPGGSTRKPWRHCLVSALLLFPCFLSSRPGGQGHMHARLS